MVGRPSSGRCEVCRKRKIKCDRRTPSCSQCIKSGWTCPGYEQKWEFRDGLTASTRSEAQGSAVVKSQSRASSISNPSDGEGFVPMEKRNLLPPMVFMSKTELFRSEFSWRITNRTISARMGLIPWEPYLGLMVSRFGCSPALDDAAACLLLSPLSRSNDDVVAPKSYGKALYSLQTALACPETRFHSDTLAAILLLQMYEHHCSQSLMAGASTHAKALIDFIQLAGPNSFIDEFPRAVMTAEIGNIVMGSVLHKQDCFLAQEEWLTVLGLSVPADFTVRILQQLALNGVEFPRLVRRYHSITSLAASATLEDPLSNHLGPFEEKLLDVIVLMQEIRDFQKGMEDWLRRESQNEPPKPTNNMDNPYPTLEARTYGLWLAFLAVARTFMIIAHYMTEHLRWVHALKDESISSAQVKQLTLHEKAAVEACKGLSHGAKKDIEQFMVLSAFSAVNLVNGMTAMVRSVVGTETPASTVSSKIHAILVDLFPTTPSLSEIFLLSPKSTPSTPG